MWIIDEMTGCFWFLYKNEDTLLVEAIDLSALYSGIEVMVVALLKIRLSGASDVVGEVGCIRRKNWEKYSNWFWIARCRHEISGEVCSVFGIFSSVFDCCNIFNKELYDGRSELRRASG